MGLSTEISHDPTGYNQAGNAYFWLKRVNSDGSAIAGEDWVLFPEKKTDKTSHKSNSKKIFRADKKLYKIVSDNDEFGFEAVLLQDDYLTEKFLSTVCKGDYFAALKPGGISHVDSSTQKNMHKLRWYPVGQVDVEYESTEPDGREPTLKFNAIPVSVASTLEDTGCPTDFDEKCELDGTAYLSLAFSVAAQAHYDVQICKMTY